MKKQEIIHVRCSVETKEILENLTQCLDRSQGSVVELAIKMIARHLGEEHNIVRLDDYEV